MIANVKETIYLILDDQSYIKLFGESLTLIFLYLEKYIYDGWAVPSPCSI